MLKKQRENNLKFFILILEIVEIVDGTVHVSN